MATNDRPPAMPVMPVMPAMPVTIENDALDEYNPFEGVEDDVDPGPAGTRAALLESARRGYAPLRKTFVQHPRSEGDRPSVLGAMVTARYHRPLDLLLLLHALQPILDDSPLPLGMWARLMSCGTPCTSTAVTRAFDTLVDLRLIARHGRGRRPVYVPLREDGRGAPWTRPGADQEGDTDPEPGVGYFTLPHDYWTAGWAERLKLPGKALLLIMLAETQSPSKTTFVMAAARAQEWYGISERTAERGYTELRQADLTAVRVVKKFDRNHPAGRREVYHRALNRPFRTPDRARLQRAATSAARAKAARDGGEATTQLLGDAKAATLAVSP